MRTTFVLTCLGLLACSACSHAERVPPRPLKSGAENVRSRAEEGAAYVSALREEYRALGRIQRTLGWYSSTQGETSLLGLTYVGHDRLFRRTALDAVDPLLAGAQGNEKLALRFFRRALTGELVQLSIARFDDEYEDAEASATAKLSWLEQPVAYRDLSNLIAQEKDEARRQEAFRASARIMTDRLNPILEHKEEAAQKAAREAGYADYVALSEELREVKLEPLLAQGAAYVKATDATMRALLDRLAREDLGVGREQLRAADLPRIFKAPRLGRFFDKALETRALLRFLSGMGLDLSTAAGTQIVIDDSLHPKKRPRAFMNPVNAPADVRLSVKPTGGLDDYGTLFHEAGHAVHYAAATIEPNELVHLGHGAPTEAFGEFFRYAFSDPRWLVRYREFLREEGRPVPTNAELASILRHTAFVEMYLLRRYAWAKIAYELELHGRHPVADLRESYRRLFSEAYTFELNDLEAQRFRTDVDDTFYSADYARSFVLADLMHEGIRKRFGDDFYGNPAVGKFLRAELFAAGSSLSPGDVAGKLGFASLDFSLAAARAQRLVADADALEKGR